MRFLHLKKKSIIGMHAHPRLPSNFLYIPNPCILGTEPVFQWNRARTEAECSFFVNIYISETEKRLVVIGPLSFLRCLDEEQANLKHISGCQYPIHCKHLGYFNHYRLSQCDQEMLPNRFLESSLKSSIFGYISCSLSSEGLFGYIPIISTTRINATQKLSRGRYVYQARSQDFLKGGYVDVCMCI